MIKPLIVYKPQKKTFPWELVGLDVYVFFAGGNFTFTDDFDKADIIPHNDIASGNDDDIRATYNFIKRKGLRRKIFLNLQLFLHVQESQDHASLDAMLASEKKFFGRLVEKSRPKHFILHCNRNLIDIPQFIYSDFLWNREIAFFVDQPDNIFSAKNKYESRGHWYPIDLRKAVYELYDIDKYCNEKYIAEIKQNNQGEAFNFKSFYSNNNVRNINYLNSEYVGFNNQKVNVPYQGSLEHKYANVRDNLRNELNKLLELYPGYIGKKASGNFLIGQDMTSDEYVKSIVGLYPNIGWWPINNVYCRSTSVNIYIETLTYNHDKIRQITEKTWDPLIKGNFILPFGQCGLIDDLKKHYGFKFPRWIDYSYDSIGEDMLRWFAYLDSVKELLSNSPKELFRKKIADKEILKYNREIFFKHRYKNAIPDSLHYFFKKNSEPHQADSL